jgi:hypothetical protein
LGNQSESKLMILSIKNNFINDRGFKDFSFLIKEKIGPMADIK